MAGFVNPWNQNSGADNNETSSRFSNPWSNMPTTQPNDNSSVFQLNPDNLKSFQTASTPTQQSSWHSLLDNPLTHGLGAAYNYGKGVLSGVGNAFTGNNQAQPSGGLADKLRDTANQFMHPSQFLQHNWDAIKNIPSAIAQGFTDPNQATQNFEHGIQNDANTMPSAPGGDPFSQVAGGALKYGVGAMNDPLLYMPIGKALQGVKWASDAAGATPYISKAFNTVTSPLVNNPVANGIKDVYGTLFKKGFGTSADTMPTMNGLQGTMGADQYAIQNKMAELSKAHGLTPDQLAEVPHVIDGRVSMDPRVNQAARELSDTLNGGFQSAHGKVYGTDAELRNGFTGKAPSLQDLFSGKSGNPIRSGSVENYYPRRFNNTPEEVTAALDQYNHAAKGLSTNGVFNQKRSFDTLQEAIDHGLKPEMNPYVAIGQRLAETSKAVHTDNAIKQLLYSGVVGKEAGDGLTESIVKPFNSHIVDVPGKEPGDTTSLMQKYFMKPRDQSAIMRSIDPQGSKTAAENVLDKIAQPYDAATRLYKQLALYNPLVHGHNIGYNGMYLGGANPSHVAETMANLAKGNADPWYDRALAAGAVSSDTKGATSFSDALRGSVSPEDKTMMQNIGGGIDYARHGSLWDADKAMRTSIFRQATEGGAADAEAAAKANKYMINYNNTTPFESATMKRIFPFYSWMKGNLPLQAEQWINNTPKQVAAEKAIDAASQALSGNDSRDGKLDTGKSLADGSHVMVDPYIPSADITKMLRDGPIPFLFNRSNPFLKEVADEAANKAYSPVPLTTANGKDYLNKTEIRPPGADAGYDTRSTIAHTLKTVNPFSGGGVGGNVDTTSLINQLFGLKTKDVPGKSLEERTIPWLGAFTSRYNPMKESKNKQYQDRQEQRDRNSFNQSQGTPVSKDDKRKAYRKIK